MRFIGLIFDLVPCPKVFSGEIDVKTFSEIELIFTDTGRKRRNAIMILNSNVLTLTK